MARRGDGQRLLPRRFGLFLLLTLTIPALVPFAGPSRAQSIADDAILGGALAHSIAAFVFNIGVIAFTINSLAR